MLQPPCHRLPFPDQSRRLGRRLARCAAGSLLGRLRSGRDASSRLAWCAAGSLLGRLRSARDASSRLGAHLTGLLRLAHRRAVPIAAPTRTTLGTWFTRWLPIY